MTGKELREWRKHMGWTQARMAERLGYSVEHISRMENEFKPVQPVLELALKALEVE